jgi:hypothetical protein
MITIELLDNKIFIYNSWYNIESIVKINESMVDVSSSTDEGHRYDTTFIEGMITINGTLQTSAQMIFDTLSNGQS